MLKRILIWVGAIVVLIGLALGGLLIYISRQMGSLDAVLRERAIEYLSNRFDAQVELREIHVHLPRHNLFTSLFRRGRGLLAEVDGAGLLVRYHQRADLPPMFQIQSFRASIGFEGLLRPSRRVAGLKVEGMEINIPPREDRPASARSSGKGPVALSFGEARIQNLRLVILPKVKSKEPLEFQIHDIKLEAANEAGEVRYQADLLNPKPPGQIVSQGMFGPWEKDDPGGTPLSGNYDFSHADLAVFPAIAGILHSTGTFSGVLSTITAKGQATVPDFRLKRANNPVNLQTSFEVLVDGTNGNTELKPVNAILGSTAFTTSGAILKQHGQTKRSIDLTVHMKQGEVRDLLTLAMAGRPMLKGKIDFDAAIKVPPISGKVKEKLIVDGTFSVSDGYFLKSKIRQRLDGLSRRAQGEPNDLQIEDVMTELAGKLHIEDAAVNFSSLNFSVPGARVALMGSYDMNQGDINFDGSASLDAKVSQTLTGWKRILVKPFDPLFARNGAGTFLPIEIRGDSKHPKFSVPIGKALTGSTNGPKVAKN
jgi:hypothetical protein